MDGEGSRARRDLLVASLTVVAADASEQWAWVDRYGMLTDEIALDFEHALRGQTELGRAELAREVLADLDAIDAVFRGLSRPAQADRWSREALASEPSWAETRARARRALLALVGEWRLPMPELRQFP